MILINDISVSVSDWNENASSCLKKHAAKKLGISEFDIKTVLLLKKSLDARKKNIRYNLSAAVETVGAVKGKIKGYAEYEPKPPVIIEKIKKTPSNPPVVVGFGPSGIFAALILARAGANPIVLERGGDTDTRKIKVNDFWENGRLCTDSNVQFGEGGAGTFSDGKLTTGIKSPYIPFILAELVKHGAPPEILYESKPHIGTDLLSEVVKSIRHEIVTLGGRVVFGARFTDFTMNKGAVSSVIYTKDSGDFDIETHSLILAIGHSARDTFALLHKKSLALSAKPFSAGLRAEHLQRDINTAMYGADYFNTGIKLPPADYKLSVRAEGGRGVYTFCMCPGGFVVASSSEANCTVTNGMSFHARSGANANSALLVNVHPSDFASDSPLAGIEFQRAIEQRAFAAGGYNYTAPAVMTGDFLNGGSAKAYESFGRVTPTYKPGVKYAMPDEYLPRFICDALRYAIPVFGKKIKGFDVSDSVLTGPETRSSSPVRIERNQRRESVSHGGIYPCGEGAGYAGGIMSAAADGVETAFTILARL